MSSTVDDRLSGTQPPIAPWIGVVISLFAVSAAALFIRSAQALGTPSLAIAAWRLSFAVLILTPLVLWRNRRELATLTRAEVLLALGSGAFLGLHFATWISSLAYTTIVSSTVLVATSPLLVGLLAPLLLNEPLTRGLLIGITVATVGAVIIGVADSCAVSVAGLTCSGLAALVQGERFLGNVLAFVGAIGAAGYIIIGRRLRARLSLNTYIWLVYGTAAIVLLLAALAWRVPLLGYDRAVWGWLVLLALVPQLIGHSLWNWALRYLPAAIVSVMTLGEPIAATALGIVFLGEVPGALTLVGGALILGGIALATFSSRSNAD